MDRKEYLLNEVGIEIARENIAKLMRKAMQESDKNKFKSKSNILLQDIEKIERGERETIKKYMEVTDVE